MTRTRFTKIAESGWVTDSFTTLATETMSSGALDLALVPQNYFMIFKIELMELIMWIILCVLGRRKRWRSRFLHLWPSYLLPSETILVIHCPSRDIVSDVFINVTIWIHLLFSYNVSVWLTFSQKYLHHHKVAVVVYHLKKFWMALVPCQNNSERDFSLSN